MQLTASRDTLLDGLLTASRALSTRTALPALGGIMLEADADTVLLRATDSEMALVVPVAAEVSAGGSVLLPGRLLLEVVRALPEGTVELEARSEQRDVEVRSSSARFHLRTLSADDFPTFPAPSESPIVLPAGPLAETIERVAVAASRDEVRPILTGILIQAEGSTVTMVATDSYRLSVKRTELEAEVGASIEATVPARALRELSRLSSQAEAAEIKISMLGSQIVFEVAGAILSSRLIDGQFPSHNQLIPDSFDYEVKLDREEFLEVTKRVRHLAQRQVPLKLAFSDGQLEVAAETPDIGDARDAMPAPYEGDLLEIAFNPQFLIEGIESIAGEQILIRISSPLRPGLLVPVDSEDFSYLVMPIRLNV